MERLIYVLIHSGITLIIFGIGYVVFKDTNPAIVLSIGYLTGDYYDFKYSSKHDKN